MHTTAAPLALLWHRTDLRLSDHPALRAAAQASSGRVLGVMVLPEITRASPRRVGYLLQTIEELRAAWRAQGSALIVLRGKAHERIPALAVELGVREVHTAPCPAFDEQLENAAVQQALAAHSIALVVHDEVTLIATPDLPFAIDALPDVFSNFRRAVEREGAWGALVREPLEPCALACLPVSLVTELDARTEATLAAEDLGAARSAAQQHDPRSAFHCQGGRSHALARIRHWFWDTDSIARYKQTRDGLQGADFSSRLSPWLALGAVSPREVAKEIHRYERERTANESTYWLGFELLWRDYFHFWVRRHGRRAFAAAGVRGRTPCGAQDAALFDQWCRGRTGEPFVDAAMRELAATGQLSNRARQNVASWLTRTAGIDWRWGAAWFEQQLIDFDVGPNWGNWQYVAGVGNDPRNRVFNVKSQAERYDPDGAYQALWLG
ncbi:MAG: DASH family cryptochrome [Sinobacteraceae bacterium]|nr:DASH family cryptochrome [Nevskiaceae bacterium]